MKITIFANGVSYGGAEHVACELANFFVGRGYDVDLITVSDDDPTFEISEDVVRIPLIHVSERRGFIYNLIIRISRIYRYCLQADTCCYIAIMQAAMVSLLSLKVFLDAPVIITERSNPFRYSLLKKIVLKVMVSRADACVFQTNGQKDFYSRWLRHCKYEIIPNAVDVSTNILPWEEREKIIVAVGRLHTVKNFPMLINAFAKIKNIDQEYKLVIYGEGDERSKLKELTVELGIKNRVELVGFTRNVTNYIKKAKIFVLSSNYEGMPNALLEAMSLGLACISTDCEAGGARKLLANNDNGLLIPVGDEDRLANALEELIQNDETAKIMAYNATKIRKDYSPDRVYKKWEELVISCID